MRVDHSLEISAPIETVWALTEDVERWPELSPTTMTSVERLDTGPLRTGSSARIKQPAQRATVWTVTDATAPTSFSWSTKVASITMTAMHTLEPTATGCRNTLVVETKGFGSGLLGLIAGRKIRQTIETENLCFKRAAEA